MTKQMTGEQLKAIRLKLGLSRAAFGYALGYRGKPQNTSSLIWAMEGDAKPIMPWISNLARMYLVYGVPRENMPLSPNGGEN